MFVASFYCYLKHDYKNDFVIDLDDVWKCLGFQQKVKAKAVLEKHFVINKDYKLLLSQPGKQEKYNYWSSKRRSKERKKLDHRR